MALMHALSALIMLKASNCNRTNCMYTQHHNMNCLGAAHRLMFCRAVQSGSATSTNAVLTWYTTRTNETQENFEQQQKQHARVPDAAFHAGSLSGRRQPALYLFMLGFERIVVAYYTASLRPVLGSGSSTMRQMAESREVFLDIQDVGVCVHALQEHSSLQCTGPRLQPGHHALRFEMAVIWIAHRKAHANPGIFGTHICKPCMTHALFICYQGCCMSRL